MTFRVRMRPRVSWWRGVSLSGRLAAAAPSVVSIACGCSHCSALCRFERQEKKRERARFAVFSRGFLDCRGFSVINLPYSMICHSIGSPFCELGAALFIVGTGWWPLLAVGRVDAIWTAPTLSRAWRTRAPQRRQSRCKSRRVALAPFPRRRRFPALRKHTKIHTKFLIFVARTPLYARRSRYKLK